MKKARLFAITVLLLAFSAPAFAICGYCDPNTDECVYDPTAGGGCRTVRGIDWWYCTTGYCGSAAAPEETAKLEFVSVSTELASITLDAPPAADAADIAVRAADAK